MEIDRVILPPAKYSKEPGIILLALLAKDTGVRCRWYVVVLHLFAQRRGLHPSGLILAPHIYLCFELQLFQDNAFAFLVEQGRARLIILIGIFIEPSAAKYHVLFDILSLHSQVSTQITEIEYVGQAHDPGRQVFDTETAYLAFIAAAVWQREAHSPEIPFA